jgi:hypothetical protein
MGPRDADGSQHRGNGRLWPARELADLLDATRAKAEAARRAAAPFCSEAEVSSIQ